jgi:hypothetical protein
VAKRKRKWDYSVYTRYLREGRGQGCGNTYKPWITIHDLPSTGVVSRVKGIKTDRIHHLMSHLELDYFLTLEWSDKVIDIREQFPLLDVNETIRIAKELGFKHPTDQRSSYPYVLSCDFMILMENGTYLARTLKQSKDLENPRTREKLLIEREYWQRKHIDWKIVTEQQMDRTRIQNLKLLHPFARLNCPTEGHREYLSAARYIISECRRHPMQPLQAVAERTDTEFSLPAGSCLTIIKHLIWTRKIHIDLQRAIRFSASGGFQC